MTEAELTLSRTRVRGIGTARLSRRSARHGEKEKATKGRAFIMKITKVASLGALIGGGIGDAQRKSNICRIQSDEGNSMGTA